MRGTAKALRSMAVISKGKAKRCKDWQRHREATRGIAMDMLCTDAHREAKAQYCYTL